MPKLELGDLEAVRAAKESNIPVLAKLVDEGWDLTALVPSCVLMFKQELPLMFPDDADVQKVKAAFFDPFEYLMLRHRDGQAEDRLQAGLGKVVLSRRLPPARADIGPKTKELLSLVPGTEVDMIERCSGHDGTYAVKAEFHAFVGEDRQAGRGTRQPGEARPLRLRLRDGRPSHRAPARRGRRRASHFAAAQGLRSLTDADSG